MWLILRVDIGVLCDRVALSSQQFNRSCSPRSAAYMDSSNIPVIMDACGGFLCVDARCPSVIFSGIFQAMHIQVVWPHEQFFVNENALMSKWIPTLLCSGHFFGDPCLLMLLLFLLFTLPYCKILVNRTLPQQLQSMPRWLRKVYGRSYVASPVFPGGFKLNNARDFKALLDG